MDLKLKNKTALVTASTAGIGYSIAESLRAEGVSVVINGRSHDRVHSARAKLDSLGLVADLSTTRGRAELFATYPMFDIIVHNLGVYESKDYRQISEADWKRLWETNVLSGALIAQHYLPKMVSKNWGRMIFVASEAGVNIPPEMLHYGVSKAAQIALARGLAEQTKGTNVTVNSVLPGPTHSEGINRFLDDALSGISGERTELETQFMQRLRPSSLLQRFAEGVEVASLVTYLASPLASATNGAALRVEGGLLRNPS